MLGNLQLQKSHHYFDLIDRDEDGFINGGDFDLQAESLADERNLEEDDREALQEQMQGWWRQLCATADTNADDRVSRDEWDEFWKAINASVEEGDDPGENDTLKSLERAAKVTFRTIDTTGSGQISEEEYADWLTAWGAEGSSEAFARLDREDNGYLTEDDLVEATKEFYLSNDPDAPGNSLYGMLQ